MKKLLLYLIVCFLVSSNVYTMQRALLRNSLSYKNTLLLLTRRSIRAHHECKCNECRKCDHQDSQANSFSTGSRVFSYILGYIGFFAAVLWLKDV